MFKILVSDPISDIGIQQLYDAEDVQVDKTTGLSEDELIRIIPEYDALIVRSQTKVTPRILEAATKLKVIGRAGVGVDNINLEEATSRGVIVINAPDGNTISTCEHTFAMIMAVARQIPQAYRKTVSGDWDRRSFVGVELNNKTLGIIGMGRIGSEVAKRAKAFGMEVIGYDPFLSEERAEKMGIRLASVDEIAVVADFITVHTPLTKETRHLLSRPQFAIMKKGVRIVNCARGGIIDEEALAEAIDSRIVAGAAFDVFEEEPPRPDHPFLKHPNIIVTPHLGASTVEAQENVAIDVSQEVLHVLRQQPFKNAVNMPPVSPAVMSKLQPYFSLGEKMGSWLGQVTDDAILEIVVNYSGDLIDVDTSALTRYVVKGVLSHQLESANIVNAMHLAKSRGVHIIVQNSTETRSFTNLLTLTVKSKSRERVLSGTLLAGYGERIVRINQFPVDVAPKGHLLLVSHNDKPGIIGRVGTLLGDNQVNIATMQVGRKVVGGAAIMLLTTDKPLNQDVLNQFHELPEIMSVKQLTL